MSQNILLSMGPRTSPNWHTFNLQLRIGSTRRAPCPIVILFLKPTPFLSTSNLNAIAFQGGAPHPYNKKILFLIQGALYELSTYHLNVSFYRGVYRDVMGDII